MPAPPPENIPLTNSQGVSRGNRGDNFPPGFEAGKNMNEIRSEPPVGEEGKQNYFEEQEQNLNKDSPFPQSTFRPGEQSLKAMPEEFRGTKGTRKMPLSPPIPRPGGESRPLPSAAGGEKEAKKQMISKKISIILIVLLIIGGGVFVYFNWFSGPQSEVPPLSPPELPPAGLPPATPPSEEPASSPTPEPASSPTQDSDSDGLTDQEEEELGTNLQDADSDNDTIPDGWEVERKLNPLDPGDASQDPDGDGLDNAQEYYYGTNPENPDTDGDSYPDGLEVKNGYDPAVSGAKLEEEGSQKELGLTTTPEERDGIRKNDLKALELALQLYYDDNGFFPKALGELVPDYVVKIPEDPLNFQDYQYTRLHPAGYELTIPLEDEADPDDLLDGVQDHLYKMRVVE